MKCFYAAFGNIKSNILEKEGGSVVRVNVYYKVENHVNESKPSQFASQPANQPTEIPVNAECVIFEWVSR